MAVGDVINDVGTVSGDITFQPASGVEIIITSAHCNGSTKFRIRDASNIASVGDSIDNQFNCKVCITNTNYLFIDGTTGSSTGYTGIQIK